MVCEGTALASEMVDIYLPEPATVTARMTWSDSQETWPFHRHKGYPVDLMSWSWQMGLLAGGETPDERRRNRVALTNMHTCSILPGIPMKRGYIEGMVCVQSSYRGKNAAFPEKFEIAVRIPTGGKPTAVRAVGRDLRPDDDYVVQRNGSLDYVFIPVNDMRNAFGKDFYVCDRQRLSFEVTYDVGG